MYGLDLIREMATEAGEALAAGDLDRARAWLTERALYRDGLPSITERLAIIEIAA